MAAIAGLAAACVLAGCASPATPQASATPSITATPSTTVPSWSVGDWWNFTSPGGPLTYAVSGQVGSDYTMDTDNAGLAFFDARTDVSTLGAIRVSDLAGSQGKTRVAFFDWPLQDAKQWNTTWDGQQVHVRAHRTSATGAAPARYTMTATRTDGSTYATYDYDAAIRWFSRLAFFDAQGANQYELKLAAHGSAFAKPLVRWSLDPIQDEDYNATPTNDQGQFNVPAGATDVWIQRSVDCTAGSWLVLVGPLGSSAPATGMDDQGTCPAQDTITQVVPVVAGAEGSWGYLTNAAGNPPVHLHVTVLVRTRVTFTAGHTP